MEVLVIAPNPARAAQREGFMQRVAAIDALLRQHFKVHYYDDSSSVARQKALRRADVIYVHSVYQLQRIVAHLPAVGHKVILDMHGVVPEEEEFKGQMDRAREVGWLESRAFESVRFFVAVSEAMVEHLASKYPVAARTNWIVLPIFETGVLAVDSEKEQGLVVYAGGGQAWQKVDLMVKAIKEAEVGYRYEILTPDRQSFESIESYNSVTIRSVDSAAVSETLKSAEMGFVLRDDHLVNRVACPTKLVEYMSHGVVPIVLSPSIGDAERLGFAYVSLHDFVSAHPGDAWLARARETNSEVLAKMRQQVVDGSRSLTQAIEAIGREGHAKEYSVAMSVANSLRQFVTDNRFRLSSWRRRLNR